MNFNRVERACAVILENNQLLLLEEDGYPKFAGGGIEMHESPAEAAAREALDEVGAKVTILEALYTRATKRRGEECLEIGFLAVLDEKPTPRENASWYNLTDPKLKQYPQIQLAIKALGAKE